MKVRDILEVKFIDMAAQLHQELSEPREEKVSNDTKAKKIALRAREKAKKANPGDGDTVSGWRSDPHQGGHVMNFINR